MTEAATTITVHAEPLKALVRAIVSAAGSMAREAELVADQLVGANLTGHDSHGVGMLPRYVENIRTGGLHVNRHVSVINDAGALLTLDGNAGFGQVMGFEAMERAIERAAQFGVAVVGLANSHHIGRIGHWAEQCIAAGYVSMHYVNVLSEAVVAPFGGRDPRYSTDPFCVGIPLPGEPILLDFATARIAVGKVRVAMHKGEQVKPETLLDNRGEPTTDPRVLFESPHGAILPFGEHKGYALATVCHLLGGALTGGSTMHYKATPNRTIINNMLSIVIDPDRLGTRENLAREAATFIDWVKQSPLAPDVDRIKMPGEPERDYRRVRSAEGIPIDARTWAQLIDAAHEMGIERAAAEKMAAVAV